MGLDNYITVKFRGETPKGRPFGLANVTSYEGVTDFDFCYWRKCWQVRSLIFDSIDSFERDECYYELNKEDLLNIIEALKTLNGETWDICENIWTWAERRKTIKFDIYKLTKLCEWLDTEEARTLDYTIEFVDSY